MLVGPMRVVFSSVLSRLSRLSGGDLRSLASEVRELAPAEESESKAAIFDPAELERVQGVQEDTSWERELARISPRRTLHAATCAFRLDDVVVQGRFLHVGFRRFVIADAQGPTPMSLRTIPERPSGMFCGYLYTSRYFSHWFTEHLTAELLARELGLPSYGSARQTRYRHEAAIRRQLDLYATPIESGAFASLWVTEDFGQNASKRARYLTLRERLRTGALPVSCRGAMILRGHSGEKRLLVNESALAERLAGLGFRILDPQRDSFETMRDTLCDAPVVVGVEGSALVHAVMMMPQDACLAVIQPPGRFNNLHKNYTDCLGQRYAFTVADALEEGFHLPEGRLLALLDRIARAPETRSSTLPLATP